MHSKGELQVWQRKQGGWKREEAAVTVRPEIGRAQVAQRGAPGEAAGVVCFGVFVGTGRGRVGGLGWVEAKVGGSVIEIEGVLLMEIDGGLIAMEGPSCVAMVGGFTEVEGTLLTAIVGTGGVLST